jgi:hypothetical protein
MSFLRKFVTAVLVGAAVYMTGGLAAGGLGLTAGVKLSTLAVKGALFGGLSFVSGYLGRPKANRQAVNARLNLSVDPNALGKIVYGETSLATDIVYSEQIGDTKVFYVVAGAMHEIDSFGKFYIDDEEIEFDVNNQSTGDWEGVITIYRRTGQQEQAAIDINISQWPSTARGRGIAHYGLMFDASSENGQKKLAGGVPSRITHVAKGAKVYDPRKDTTRGGTGSHRVDDQSTWEFSGNWALVVANYLIGVRLFDNLVYGVGVEPDDIDWQQVADMADVCDTEVDGKPKYHIGGILDITNDHEQTIGLLESAVDGKVSRVGGKYYIWCPHDDTANVKLTITDDDIVSEQGIVFSPTDGLTKLYNTARGQYVSPDELFQLTAYPQVEESTAVTDDGKQRILTYDLTMIQEESVAQRIARERIRRSRFTASISMLMGPRYIALKPFDIVEVNVKETNNQTELFRVVSINGSVNGFAQVELIEEDASIYDTSAALGPSLTQLSPSAYNPTQTVTPANVQAANVVVQGTGSAKDAIRLTWNDPGAFVRETEVRFRINSTSTDYEHSIANFSSSIVISPVESVTEYDLQVRHITREGVFSDWIQVIHTSGDETLNVIRPDQIEPFIDPIQDLIDDLESKFPIQEEDIGDLQISKAKFANDIEPVVIVDTLPTTDVGDVVFLTTDSKLYRWNGTEYTKEVENEDISSLSIDKLTAGTITAAFGNINTLTIGERGILRSAGKDNPSDSTAGFWMGWNDVAGVYQFGIGTNLNGLFWDGTELKIAGKVIVEDNINVATLSAISANMGSLTAGTITANASIRVGDPSNGGDYVFLNDTNHFIDAGADGQSVFRISKTAAQSFINGGFLSSGTVDGIALSEDAIDTIRNAIGSIAPDTGGIRSRTSTIATGTFALDSFESDGSTVNVRFNYGGQLAFPLLPNTPTPQTPTVQVVIKRGATTIHTQTYNGSVTQSEPFDSSNSFFEIEMPVISVIIDDTNAPTGAVSYSVELTVNNWNTNLYGSLFSSFTFRTSQTASGGAVGSWTQLTGKPFDTIGTGLSVTGTAPNRAVGVDGTVVRTSGDQNISGDKSFLDKGIFTNTGLRNQLKIIRQGNQNNALIEAETSNATIVFGHGTSGNFVVGPSGYTSGASAVFSVDANTGGVSWTGTASGDGSGLTNLNAPTLAQFANAVLLTGGQTITGTKTFANNQVINVPASSSATPSLLIQRNNDGAGSSLLDLSIESGTTNRFFLRGLGTGGSVNLSFSTDGVMRAGTVPFDRTSGVAAASHTHAASDIVSGTIAAARLSGTYNINITGNAATVTNGVYTVGNQTIGGVKEFSDNGTLLNKSILRTSNSDFATIFRRAGVDRGGIYLTTQNTELTGLNGNDVSIATSSDGSRGVQRLRVTSAGNVGIGTSSPATKLQVEGAIRGGSFPSGTTNSGEAWFGRASNRTLGTMTFQLGGSSATGTNFEIVDRAWSKVMYRFSGVAPGGTIYAIDNGNVGIGTTTPSQRLHVVGNILASGTIRANSDARLKENIEPITNAVEKVQAITGVTYTRNDTEDKDERETGVIAQAVEAVLPEAVATDEDGIKSVAYGNMVGLLIQAIKEQQEQIDEQQKRIEKLEQRLNSE